MHKAQVDRFLLTPSCAAPLNIALFHIYNEQSPLPPHPVDFPSAPLKCNAIPPCSTPSYSLTYDYSFTTPTKPLCAHPVD